MVNGFGGHCVESSSLCHAGVGINLGAIDSLLSVAIMQGVDFGVGNDVAVFGVEAVGFGLGEFNVADLNAFHVESPFS